MNRLFYRLLAIAALLMVAGCNCKEEVETPTPAIKFVCTAHHFDGEYYGDHFTPGVGNYFIHISTKGFQESGFAMPNGTFFRIDLYGALYEGDNTDSVPVPKGVYKLDKNNTFANGTFSMANSKFLKSDNEGYFTTTKSFDYGELQITDEGARLVVRFDDKEYTAIYEGETMVKDMRSSLGKEDPDSAISTLTGDYTVQLDDHELMYVWYGDYYYTGLHNWMVVIWPKSRVGDHVQFDLMSQRSASDYYYGNYTAGDTNRKNSFLKGYISGDDSSGYYMEGSWYYTDDGALAPFVDGALAITHENDNTTTVTFTLLDDRGNTISGTWSGMAQEY
jgi:hypothetical protein